MFENKRGEKERKYKKILDGLQNEKIKDKHEKNFVSSTIHWKVHGSHNLHIF